MKKKIRTYDDKVYTKFCRLNENLLQSLLLILYLYMKTNITCKYI